MAFRYALIAYGLVGALAVWLKDKEREVAMLTRQERQEIAERAKACKKEEELNWDHFIRSSRHSALEK